MKHHPNKLLDGSLVLVLLLSGVRQAPAAEPGPWGVQINGSDVTSNADPSERGGALVVNVSALALALRLNVRAQGNEVVILDASGAEWHGRQGQTSLDGLGQHRPLASPIVIEGSSVYLPLETAAALAGLELTLDGRVARLEPAGSTTASAADEWESFSVPKTAEELERDGVTAAANQGILTGRDAVERLPQAHDSVQLSTDVGYVQGADWGSEVAASGKIAGVQTDFNFVTTLGEQGLESVSKRLSLLDPEAGWGVEAGDLYSEIRGSAAGLRASLKAGDKRWPTVSLYLKDSKAGYSSTVLSFRDEFAFTPNLALGGEVATDGSLILKSRFRLDRLNLNAFLLRSPRASLGGGGLNAGYFFGNGISLQGGISRSGSGQDRTDSRNLSLLLPILRALDMTLDYSHTATASNRSNSGGASLRFPLGPARLYVRYQLQDTTIALLTAATTQEFSTRQHSLLSSISYSPVRQLSFSVDGSSTWTGSGDAQPRAQLVAAYQISASTRFQVAGAFPNVVNPEQLRLRLDLGLPKDFAIIAEYGRLSPFQSTTTFDPEQELFKLTLRKRFSMATPGSGGQVRGTIQDSLGQPVAGAGVQLGNYIAVADQEGRYAFKNVPAGTYEAKLSRDGLPVNYGTQEAAKSLEITRSTRESVDFAVVQLDVVRGWVYLDKDGDGARDPEEGVERIPLKLEGQATATGKDGSFAFYNLPPGPHSVQLPAEYLPETYALDSPSEAAVELVAGKPSAGMEFRLIPKDKEIVFQDLEPEPTQAAVAAIRKPVAADRQDVNQPPAASSEPAAPTMPSSSASLASPGSLPARGAPLAGPAPGVGGLRHGALKEAMDQLAAGHAVEIRREAGKYYVLADGEPTGAFRVLSDVPVSDGPLGEAAALLSRGAAVVSIGRNEGQAGEGHVVQQGRPGPSVKPGSASRPEPDLPQYQRDLLLFSPAHGALREAMAQLERGRSVEIRSEAGFYHVLANGKPMGAFRVLSDVPQPGGALGEAAALLARGVSVVRIERHEGESGPGYLVRRAMP